MRVPVNKFPDFVRYVVQRLRVLCPTMGKVKIAQTLARAGIHVGATTVGRMLKDKPAPAPKPAQEGNTTDRVVTSKYPNHVWLIDLTLVPTGSGFWSVAWLTLGLNWLDRTIIIRGNSPPSIRPDVGCLRYR